MRTRVHPPRPLVRVAVSYMLAGAALASIDTRSPLHAQPVSPSLCTIVAERSLTTPNVVWGLWAPDIREPPCDADSRGADSTNCNAIGVDVAWFWESADLLDFGAIGECCDACADAPPDDATVEGPDPPATASAWPWPLQPRP